MKVGIIRCHETEDLCGGNKDFHFAARGEGAFEQLGNCEIVGFVTCGGCPGKKAVMRARMLKKQGCEAIALASCMTKGSPIGFPCPNRETIYNAIRGLLGEDFPILNYTHPAPEHKK